MPVSIYWNGSHEPCPIWILLGLTLRCNQRQNPRENGVVLICSFHWIETAIINKLMIGLLINGSPSQNTKKPGFAFWVTEFSREEILSVQEYTDFFFFFLTPHIYPKWFNHYTCKLKKSIFLFFFPACVLTSWPVVPCWTVCLGFLCGPLSWPLPQAVFQSW